jgi:hypothetical protein
MEGEIILLPPFLSRWRRHYSLEKDSGPFWLAFDWPSFSKDSHGLEGLPRIGRTPTDWTPTPRLLSCTLYISMLKLYVFEGEINSLRLLQMKLVMMSTEQT